MRFKKICRIKMSFREIAVVHKKINEMTQNESMIIEHKRNHEIKVL